MNVQDKLIAKQAKDIFEKDQYINELEGALKSIRINLVCIGGPLNDNVKNYSPEQLKLFFHFDHIINDTLR